MNNDQGEVRREASLVIVKDQPENQAGHIHKADAESPHPKPQGKVRALPTNQLLDLTEDFPRNPPRRGRLNLSPQDGAEAESVARPEEDALRHFSPSFLNHLRDAPHTLTQLTPNLFRKAHAYHLSPLFSLFPTPSPGMRSRHLMTGCR
jgi:hypothetical protein